MTVVLLGKALAIWAVMAILAVFNGFTRQAVFVPALGEPIGRPLSAVSMLAIVYLLAWLFITWAGRPTRGTLWVIGALWLVLTVAFESALGVFLRGMSAGEIIATYNPLAPTLWFFVLLGVLLAPPIVGLKARNQAHQS